MGHFFGVGPMAQTLGSPHTIGGFEAHGLAIIIGVLLSGRHPCQSAAVARPRLECPSVVRIGQRLVLVVFPQAGSPRGGYSHHCVAHHFCCGSSNLSKACGGERLTTCCSGRGDSIFSLVFPATCLRDSLRAAEAKRSVSSLNRAVNTD